MKLFLSVVLSVICFAANAQNLVLVDTADSKFKKQLVNLYSSRVAKQQLQFNQQLSDKKIRKEVDVLYKDFSEDFIESINKGFFCRKPNVSKILRRYSSTNSEKQSRISGYCQYQNTSFLRDISQCLCYRYQYSGCVYSADQKN